MTNYPSKWSARSSVVHVGVSATLKNLAANTAVKLSEVDNSAGSVYGDFELYCRGAGAYTAGDFVSVWFLMKADGTNLEDGDAGVIPARQPDVVFPVRAVSTQQRIGAKGVLLPNGKFTCLLLSAASQAFTNTDNENILELYTYNTQVVPT